MPHFSNAEMSAFLRRLLRHLNHLPGLPGFLRSPSLLCLPNRFVGSDGEPSFPLLLRCQLPVVLEQHDGAVPGLQCHLGGVLDGGEGVGAERMPQAAERPMSEASMNPAAGQAAALRMGMIFFFAAACFSLSFRFCAGGGEPGVTSNQSCASSSVTSSR